MGQGTVATTASSTSKLAEKRASRRYTVAPEFPKASWMSVKGDLRTDDIRVLNVSESGMALELPERPQDGTQIWLRHEKHHLDCYLLVRHCYEHGRKFVVGVQFTEGLHWTPPPDGVSEPIPLTSPVA